jgi:SAM-dependent methyltransferase
VAQAESFNVDYLLDGMTETQLRMRPHGLNSLAWLFWHVARVEDGFVSGIVMRRNQLFDEGGWGERLNVPRRDFGTGMSKKDVADLSESIDLSAFCIVEALGDAETVVNIGAGTGSYEPKDRFVVAVEPSITMIRQRGRDAAPVVQGFAEHLPFQDKVFAAGLALLTIHHWRDRFRGLCELSRVVRDRFVLLTWDPESEGFWLVKDYFPEFVEADRKRMPTMTELRHLFGHVEVFPLPIPHDCVDGFLGAYWRRPAEYLRSEIRDGISSFATCSDLSALKRLEDDLDSGQWERRYVDILKKSELDIGYRLIVGRPTRA